MGTTARLIAPPPELRYRRPVRPGQSLAALWRARELVWTLAERDLRVRFKQAVLGVGWAVITPVARMLVFSVFFNRVAHVHTSGPPYVLFTYLGLVPWTFFSSSVSSASQTLVANVSILGKVYFPRETFPLASVVVAGFNAVISVLVLGILFPVTGTFPRATSYWVPLLLLIMLSFTLGMALLFSIVTVFLRDLSHALPLVIQLGLFATPVAYPVPFAHGAVGVVYHAVNPMAAVIDGIRNTVLLGHPPQSLETFLGAASSVVVLGLGFFLFKRLEPGVVDVA